MGHSMKDQFQILYAGKDNDVLDTLKTFPAGQYRIQKAGSEAKYRELLSKKPVQLTIMDQELLEKAGIPFFESLLAEHRDMIMVLIGGGIPPDFILDAFNAGFVYRFLSTPLNRRELRQTVKNALKMYSENQKNQHLIHDLEYVIDELNFLHKLSQKISEKKSLPILLNEIMESSKLLMNAEASSLLLYDPDEEKLNFLVATGEKGKLVKKFSLDIGVGIGGWVAKHRKPLLVRDCYSDPRFDRECDKMTHFHTRSMICVPLIRKRKLLGVIQVINKKGGGEFEERDLTIFKTLAAHCAIAIENAQLIQIQVETEALERELETAREIQEKLLPATLPKYQDVDIAAKLVPAKQVGGDYYNIFKISENQSLFFITDVTGKGIPAALIVSTIYSCLYSYLTLNRDSFKLTDLAVSMNKLLLDSTTSDKFATCWFGLYEHDTRKLTYINAGHNPPYLYKKSRKDPIELMSGCLFLGGVDIPFETQEVRMEEQDILVLYTDGVTEAWNEKYEEYSEERLIRTIFMNLKEPCRKILEEIEKDVRLHVGKAQQSDDFTCIVIKIL
jgi:sigma-B regulation protein RsbU (phosphoserine phosphatase)